MNVLNLRRFVAVSALGVAAAIVLAPPARAQLADLADVPLANTASTSVLPNLMYILDDSGSMNWNYMPDQLFRNTGQDFYLNCKRCNTNALTVSNVNTGSSNETITTAGDNGSNNHRAAVNSTVIFIAGTPPAPLALNTVYFVKSVPSSTTLTLSTTVGGTTINLTGNTTGATVVIDEGCTGPGGKQDAGYGFTANNPTSPRGSPCGNDNTDPNDLETDQDDIPTYGEAPFYATKFNQIWYNPDITYSPAMQANGTAMTASNPTSAKADAYATGGATNLTNAFNEVIYCTKDDPTAAEKTNTAICRYNGRHNTGAFLGGGLPNYFLYFKNGTNGNVGLPNAVFRYKIRHQTSNPHYYNITPHEYCSDINLTTCALANAAGANPGGGFTIEAPVRWCKTEADAALPAVVTGNTGSPATPRCRKKFDATSHPYPRLGRFNRVDIWPTQANHTRGATSVRTDCASASVCTHAEELQNFANWYSFYRTRMALMKTASGRAFGALANADRFRIGFITINPGGNGSDKFLKVNKFITTHKQSWYDLLYAQTTNGSTPLPQALSRVGRYYAGLNTGISAGMIPTATDDPVQYACQHNYALLTTDGYWNSSANSNLGSGTVDNVDSSNSGFFTRAVGAYDGGTGLSATNTLADVAAYYYKEDLRTSGAVADNIVPTSSKDTNNKQHMVTFTLGLGLEGFMDYIPDYETNTGGDFSKIKAGTSGACSWTTGVCNWPVPVSGQPSTLDDLWHAAVNARGTYFSAGDPNSLTQGLGSALSKLQVMTAAAAASATSSPNITETDNYIYSSTFRTTEWDGEIVAQRIDTVTGNVLPAIVWSAQTLLDSRSSATSDSRTIFTIDESGANKRKNFAYGSLSAGAVGAIAAEQPYFSGKCGQFSQCALLLPAQQTIANNGDNLVNYLRGWRVHEDFVSPETGSPFRKRPHILGDPVNATPAFVKAAVFNFADAVTPDYASFKNTQDTRQGVLYIAANDGMLHAFNGDTGAELWAYVPRIVMPKLHKLATANWGSAHTFNVDGSPQVMDVFTGSAWRTILVAGLNSGGRGFYALDVTDPATPKVLWEFCESASMCANWDADVGFSYGNPVITKRVVDGKWVVFVTSGMNNVTPGDGRGYLFTLDAMTGAKLSKVTTAEGTAAYPSGLNKMSGYADSFAVDNTGKFLYAGDLYGNVWKFNTATANPSVSKLAILLDGSGKKQAITSRPELGAIDGYPVIFVGTGRYLGEDDLPDPATVLPSPPGLPYAYQQSLYAIKDKGTSYGNFRAVSGVVQQTIIDGGTTRSTSTNPVDWGVNDGWFMDLNPGGTSPGERINLDPQLVQGTLVVVTNVPNNSACSIGGDSWIYQFDFKTGQFVPSSAGSVAGQKFTGQITVGAVIVRLPSGIFKGIATGATGTKTPFDVKIGGGGGNARRISWRELIQR
ncbi:pilus assembly protein [Usitatibacter palustris]|uniref:PilY1 beta-propeller domain-containing protein n=1 Tax=Usitatibacter palustris TaxID=2732487 RepID=A0A6M4HBF9_9PROT|nr:PilC/PilY family type IV pilus protein [Usitatibacter palustris]QJR16415.1 hypothetical protein DSM104440_03249 [Usitatibacter palustris]